MGFSGRRVKCPPVELDAGSGRSRGFKTCRFEQLEARHCLSFVGPIVDDQLLASTSPSAPADLPAFIGQPVVSAPPGGGDVGLSEVTAGLASEDRADVQQMPSVAVDPRDVNHVVVAYMDYHRDRVADRLCRHWRGRVTRRRRNLELLDSSLADRFRTGSGKSDRQVR